MVNNTVYKFVGSNLELRYFWKRGNIRKRVCWNRRLRPLFTLCIRVSRKFYWYLCFKLRYYIRNGAKFLQKLTPVSKITWEIWTTSDRQQSYFCRKNTFLQLEHYILKIYLNITFNYLCEKSPNYLCHFWNHI